MKLTGSMNVGSLEVTGTSVITQFRLLGGLVGISIASAISTPYIRSYMLDMLPYPTAISILKKIEALDMVKGEILEKVRIIFDNGYELQTRLLIGFSVAQFPTTMLMWRNHMANPGGQSK